MFAMLGSLGFSKGFLLLFNVMISFAAMNVVLRVTPEMIARFMVELGYGEEKLGCNWL